MRTLFFVRHGESTWNVESRLQGQTMDVPLTARGRAQATDVADWLAKELPQAPRLVSSDQLRAIQTAQIIGDRLAVPVELDPRLREQSMGTLEGKLTRELSPEPVPYGQHISEIAWGGGESVAQVYERCCQFLIDVTAPVSIVVSHGDTLRIMLAALEGRGHRDVDWIPIDNTAIIRRTT